MERAWLAKLPGLWGHPHQGSVPQGKARESEREGKAAGESGLRAQDGLEGWVTTLGNAGTLYAEERSAAKRVICDVRCVAMRCVGMRCVARSRRSITLCFARPELPAWQHGTGMVARRRSRKPSTARP